MENVWWTDFVNICITVNKKKCVISNKIKLIKSNNLINNDLIIINELIK